MAAFSSGSFLTGETLKQKRKVVYKAPNFDKISEIHYQQFFSDYLIPNKPCIFDQTLTEKWRSRREWVEIDGAPNFEFLRRNFGNATVPVANCKKEEYSSHPKQDLTLQEYLNYWENYRKQNYPSDLPCLYLKDWHFTKAFPDYEAYKTPIYFQSDWLNEFWDTQPMDDYRFVYMGPKGTWTPFHSDVYRSFSWSANICGKKKWIFYPPGQEEYLKDRFGNLVYDVTSPELHDKQKYPHFDKVKDQRLEVIQGQGQVIFVPSGWHHQVYNMEDTISINHNWLNGCNIDICWSRLQDNLESVKREINDLKDMEGWNEQCQVILNASAGINYETFIQMLKVITTNRLHVLNTRKAASYGENATDGPTGSRVINCQQDCAKSEVDKFEGADLHKPSSKGDFDLAVTEHGSQGQIVDIVTELASEKWFNDTDSSCDKYCDKLISYRTSPITEERPLTTGNCSDTSKINGPNCKGDICKSTASVGNYSVTKGSSKRNNIELPDELGSTEYNDNFSEMLNTGLGKYSACDADHMTIEDLGKHNQNIYDDQPEYNTENVNKVEYYVLYDLFRIKETLVDIMNDEDYRELNYDKENTAEFLYEQIEAKLNGQKYE